MRFLESTTEQTMHQGGTYSRPRSGSVLLSSGFHTCGPQMPGGVQKVTKRET